MAVRHAQKSGKGSKKGARSFGQPLSPPSRSPSPEALPQLSKPTKFQGRSHEILWEYLEALDKQRRMTGHKRYAPAHEKELYDALLEHQDNPEKMCQTLRMTQGTLAKRRDFGETSHTSEFIFYFKLEKILRKILLQADTKPEEIYTDIHYDRKRRMQADILLNKINAFYTSRKKEGLREDDWNFHTDHDEAIWRLIAGIDYSDTPILALAFQLYKELSFSFTPTTLQPFMKEAIEALQVLDRIELLDTLYPETKKSEAKSMPGWTSSTTKRARSSDEQKISMEKRALDALLEVRDLLTFKQFDREFAHPENQPKFAKELLIELNKYQTELLAQRDNPPKIRETQIKMARAIRQTQIDVIFNPPLQAKECQFYLMLEKALQKAIKADPSLSTTLYRRYSPEHRMEISIVLQAINDFYTEKETSTTRRDGCILELMQEMEKPLISDIPTLIRNSTTYTGLDKKSLLLKKLDSALDKIESLRESMDPTRSHMPEASPMTT